MVIAEGLLSYFDREPRVGVLAAVASALSQVGGDTVISMAGGGQMVLAGVALSSLGGAWIFGA